MSETTCPACGIEMEQIEKTTFTGREMREFQCPRCKRTQIVDCGEALWKILSDANQPPVAPSGQESAPTERQANSQLFTPPRNPIFSAMLLSSIFPGAGQALLGQKLRAALFAAGIVIFFLMYSPLRLPVHYTAFLALPCIIFGLCLLSGGAALLSNRAQERRPSRWWLLLCLPPALMATVGYTRTALWVSGFQSFVMPSRSMESTLFVGDYLMADTRWYRDRSPSQGDVLIFRSQDGFFSIKRVIAVSGSTIQGRDGLVYVNGSQLNEPRAHHRPDMPSFETWQNNFGPVTLPPGRIFVMGDNRDLSLDSRSPEVGPVDVKDVVARPLYVVIYRPGYMPDSEPAVPEVANRSGREIR
jgi:signal peptidase I